MKAEDGPVQLLQPLQVEQRSVHQLTTHTNPETRRPQKKRQTKTIVIAD
jgi:hypothetical protein